MLSLRALIQTYLSVMAAPGGGVVNAAPAAAAAAPAAPAANGFKQVAFGILRMAFFWYVSTRMFGAKKPPPLPSSPGVLDGPLHMNNLLPKGEHLVSVHTHLGLASIFLHLTLESPFSPERSVHGNGFG